MYNLGLPYSLNISCIKSSRILTTLNGLGVSYIEQPDITLEAPTILLPGSTIYSLPIDISQTINKVYVYNDLLKQWEYTSKYKITSGHIQFQSKLKTMAILFPTVTLDVMLDTSIEQTSILELKLSRLVPACYTDIRININKHFISPLSYKFSLSNTGPWSTELYSHKYFETFFMQVYTPSVISKLVIVPSDMIELSCLVS